MRNLKKFLALVMAMVMAFSLMLTVNAANPVKTFDDAGSIEEKFVEAADVLTGMKVFQGDGDGFYPARNITRAEVAALIYRLATGDVDNNRTQLYANYGNFTDVNESDWFAGYVGYCANAGYIKGRTATTFDPYGQVTGYETLAMILRAIGYDKNGEFTGPTWQTNVSALATQLGILENIKTTHYGDTLYLASRRDVVAELLFQADAKVPMVTYTTAFGYQNTGMTGGVVGTTKNPTLGLYIFGLTNDTGVIVGNQETGERVTILGRDGEKTYTGIDGGTLQTGMKAEWTAYNYPGTSVVDGGYVAVNGAAADNAVNDGDTVGDIKVDNSLFLDYKSGIDVFGYKTKFWYNGGENDGTKMGTRDNPRKVYASFDKHESDKIVYAADDANLNGSGVVGTTAQDLGPVVKDAGMVMSGNKAIYNDAFDRFTASHKYSADSRYTKIGSKTGTGDGTTDTIANNSPNKLYKIISNSTNVDGKPVLDVVIALNIQTSKITGVDNVSSFKYVSAETSGTDFLVDDNILNTTGFIAQAALVGDSTKTLGEYEVGWHITGTWSQDTVADGGRRNVSTTSAEASAIHTITNVGTDVSKAYFLLGAVATKEGVVVSYHNNPKGATYDTPGTGWVMLDDGTKLEQSVFYNTVQANTVPQTDGGNATNANDQIYGTMTYRFYLDAEGKYVGAEPIVGTEFVYGTYIDFQSDLGSSSYTYRLVGVDTEGKMVTKDIKEFAVGDNKTYRDAAAFDIDDVGIPYRGDNTVSGGVSRVQKGMYKGLAVNSAGEMVEDTDNTGGNNLATKMYTGNGTYFPKNVEITSTDVALGAVLAGNNATNSPYFTEKTRFILVSGAGTDTQKVSVYNGIGELLGGNRKVTINFAEIVSANSRYLLNNDGISDIGYRDNTVFSMSDFIYAQDNTGTAQQADVIFIPAEAVKGVGSSLYYVGDPTPVILNAYGEDATKFVMYNDGEKTERWITGLPNSGAGARDAKKIHEVDGGDHFYTLTDTGKKANDGEPIYAVDEVTNLKFATSNRSEDGILLSKEYRATTKDALSAIIFKTSETTADGCLYRVEGAKVVNLNKDATKIDPDSDTTFTSGEVWPGITDLTTLNEASSLNNVNAGGKRPKVSVVLSADGLTAEVIYVCFDQT